MREKILVYKWIGLKEFFKFFVSETCILNDGLKSIGVESFVVRNGYAMNAVRHANVLTSGDSSEANFTKCPDRSICGNIGEKHVKLKPLFDIQWNPLFPRQSSAGRFGWHP
jgi:hypothetical protein